MLPPEPSAGSNWIIDEEPHSSGYSYVRAHLDIEPAKLGGVPFEKSYLGCISPDRKVLIVVGEVESATYDSNLFILIAGDLWTMSTLEIGGKVPTWTFPVNGSLQETKDIAKDLRPLVEDMGPELKSLHDIHEIRNCIYGSGGESEDTKEGLLTKYLTDYLISIQWERELPEVWDCKECGSIQHHESETGVTFHILRADGGFLYPYSMWCTEHSVSDFDQLDYQIPSNSEIESYLNSVTDDQNRLVDEESTDIEKMRFYGNLGTMTPIEGQYIIRCNLSVGIFDGFKKFLSMTHPRSLATREK